MNNKTEYTKIILKWCDDELRQIMIGVEDKDGRNECCLIGKASENPNWLKIADVFERIREVLRPVCGYDLEDSSILSCLIGMDRDVLKYEDNNRNIGNENKEYAGKMRQIFQGVDDIPDIAQKRVVGMVKDMAIEWGLSDATIDIQKEAGIFGEYVVFARRYLFTYEISKAMESLYDINADALELEWYTVHNDNVKRDAKRDVLLLNAKEDDKYRAYRYLTSSNAHVGAYQRFKAKKEQRSGCGKEAEV